MSPALTETIRSEVRGLDSQLQEIRFRSLAVLVGETLGDRRLSLALVGVFSLLALTLTAVAIYGVVSTSVARRGHEIGIRMALGARRQSILRMVLSDGMKFIFAGLALGVAGSIALARILENMIFGISPTDSISYAGVSILLVAVGLLACYWPARRLARVDPAQSLRYE